MDTTYFERIERHCQATTLNHAIQPTRRCIKIKGTQILQYYLSVLSSQTLELMANKATQKYRKMLEKITHQIRTSKRKGIVKYQTLGWKQAKEIKLWCDSNNINCKIVEDVNIVRNKLQHIDVWHDINGNLYNDGTRDYSNQHLDFRSRPQKVVYIQIVK